MELLRLTRLLSLSLILLPLHSFARHSSNKTNHTFAISFSQKIHSAPITGRVFLIISKSKTPDPRYQMGSYMKSVPFWGKDVNQLKPGVQVVIDTSTLGYPVKDLRNLPAGNYYVQGLMNVYTQFHRADGYTIWLHNDHWGGQNLIISSGNLISSVQKIHYEPSENQAFSIKLDSVLPTLKLPPDTKQVKHIKIKSTLLSKFWGHDMYLGATILLPKGYDSHPKVYYPVVYKQGHFNLQPPFGFTLQKQPIPPRLKKFIKDYNRESGYEFQKEYNSDHFPRMIAVTFQHPTPYYDDSYAVNSVNDGPYGDAIMTELIPYIETHYRIIRKPYARVLTGGSTGGWESMALQIYHPDFFGGTWSLYPDPVDFRRFQLVNLYKDKNAFYTDTFSMPFNANGSWNSSPRYMMRDNAGQPVRTVKEMSLMEAVLGTKERSGQQLDVFDAVFGPIGKDGYPVPFWNKLTGKIDNSAVDYARDHGYDLRYYLAKHWQKIGPKLIDKLHVYVGDEDNFYLNLAVYKFQDFLKHTKNPHYEGAFGYGRPMKGHGWQPVTNSELLKMMARHITKHAPNGTNTNLWKY